MLTGMTSGFRDKGRTYASVIFSSRAFLLALNRVVRRIVEELLFNY
jgi:hypothetical protein